MSEQYVVIDIIKDCREPNINKIIVNVEQSSYSGVVLNVSRLVGIKEIIRRG